MDTAVWYCVDAARERHGPLPADEIRRRFEAGELQRRSLVWRQGMAQWQPLEQVAGDLGITLPTMVVPPSSPPATAAPTITAETPAAAPAEPTHGGEPGPARIEPAPVAKPAPATPAGDALRDAYAASSRDASALGAVNVDDVVDAGFLRRLAALMIDGLLLVIATYAIIFLMLIIVGAGVGGLMTMFEASASGTAPSGPLLVVFVLGFYVLPFLMRWAYFTFFTTSGWQATPGKRAVGIKVVDLEGRRIGAGRATGRWFAAALSYITLYIGFLMAAFTDRKQALHDMVAGTRVVDQWAYTDHPERQQRGLGGCAIAALVGIGLFFVVFVGGIIAAVSVPAYNDYTQRAKLAAVIAEGRSMGYAVAAFRANTDRCPSSFEEAGLVAPASPLVERAEAGEMADGQCAVQFTLGGADAGQFTGEYLWFTVDEAGQTGCSGSMDDKYLPADCRG